MEHEFPQRAAWHAFPDVLICAPESDVKNHPDYEQAKEGNLQDSAPAAKRLSSDMVPVKAVAALRLVTPAAAKLVPVHALEHQGINRIPAALAELLGEALGVPVETSIIQVNVVNHTGASGWHRMSSPPLFDGAVDRNRPYVLVDDFIGQGGTLANLRGHVMHHGGTVVGAICLTGRADSAKLALSNQTLDSLRRSMGLKSKNGGAKTSATTSHASPKAKRDISFVSRMLTPSERAFVKRDLQETIEVAKRTKTG